jgi:filamentous hemagglutinin family protein
MNDMTCPRTRRHRRAWERAIRRLARRAARHAGIELKPAALLPLLAMVAAPGVLALPAGGQVVNGNVSISTAAPNTMAITQGSQKGIVNWNAFSIGASETVNISQPSAQAVLLNRVVGNTPSAIAGKLNANGHVFLVNPAGVLFARGASVNVGSLVATTLGISDSDFLAGKYHFVAAPGANGRVVNQGAIAAGERGTVALLGAQVDNSGTVSAKLGTVAMGAGSDMTLDFAGDGLTMLRINGAAAQALASNEGVLQADGGQVLMSVQTADALAGTVLNQSGTVRAQSVAERGGRIVLDGGAAGVTSVAGNIDVTGGAGLAGGQADVTGYQVALQNGARVDASGATGGGRVRVGGGPAGQDTDIHNADAVWMGPGAQIRSDALDAGNGGNVVIYGTDAARVYGTLTAKGGANAGNGGLIETSGRFIDVAGATIDASAPHGMGGTWVLDPFNVDIVDSTTIDTAGGPTFTPTQDNTVITTATIENRLNAGTSVTINTGTGGTQAGDITLDGQIDKNAGGAATLTLDAAHSIFMDRTSRAGAGASITSESLNGNGAGPLDIVLRANSANSNDGTAVILIRGSAGASLALASNGGDVSIGVPPANGIAPRVAIDHVDIDTRIREVTGIEGNDLSGRVDTAAPSGAITINGSAPVSVTNPNANFGTGNGVTVQNNSSFETTTGAVTIDGAGTGSGALIVGSTATTTSGAILFTGTSATGVGMAMNTSTLRSDAGAVTLTGSGGAGGVSTNLGSITSLSGKISVDGTALASGTAARADGVSITQTPMSTTGALTIQGTAAPQGPLGAGVTLLSDGESTLTLDAGIPGVQISGSGNGYAGVSIGNIVPAGNVRTVSIRANPVDAAGPISILGVTNGAPVPDGSGVDTFNPGVLIANTGIGGSNVTLAGSVTGSSAVSGLVIQSSDVSAFGTPNPAVEGTLTLRASNNSPTTSSISIDANSTLAVTGGTLILAPGIVTPGQTFTVAADDAPSITIGVPGATGGGFTLDDSFGRRFTSSIDTIYVGSATHTGAITIGPAACIASPCAGLPLYRNLTVANGGAGSKGISLPYEVSTIAQITLDSAGPVTQGAGSLFAGNLLLAGPGSFNLTNAANTIFGLSLLGVGDSALTAQSLPITALRGNVFDAGSNTLAALDAGNQATLAGNLTLTTTGGNVSSAVPIRNISGHDITLGMHAAGSIRIGADVTSATGALNVDGDATSQVIIGGVANQTGAPRIAMSTNGGSVNLSAAGRNVLGSEGPTGVTGPAISVGSADIDTRAHSSGGALSGTGGAVTLTGLTPATTSFAGTGAGRPVAIDLDSATITTASGGITLAGQSLSPVANPGNGVILRGTASNPTQLTTTSGAVRVDGTGSGTGRGLGAYGVALTGGASITTASGPVDIRGAIAGTGAGATSPTYGVLLLDGSITAGAAGGTVSIAGSTTTADAGIGYGAVPLAAASGLTAGPFSITTGKGGTVSLLASNNGAATSLLGRSAAGSIDAQGGTLVVASASVDPASFGITAQSGVPITLFGTSATPGLSIDSGTYQTFATNLQSLVLGSSTQTASITVDGPCAGGAGCATRPFVATSLTLENTGAGSAGISLPSGISMPEGTTLALVSSGPVTDPGGIATGTLMLAGGGTFNLPDANQVGTLVIAGAGPVYFDNADSFTIGTGSAAGYDAVQGVTAISGTPETLNGNLVAISENGAITLGTAGAPVHLVTPGSIDLVQENAAFSNPFDGTLSAGNAWRVWAQSRASDENRGGLDPGGAFPNFYGCAYNGLCAWNGQPSLAVIPGGSNHFIYAQQPTLTIDIGNQTRVQGAPLGPFAYGVPVGWLRGDAQTLTLGPLSSPGTPNSPPGTYQISGSASSPIGYQVVVMPGTLTVLAPSATPLGGAVFNRSGLQPLFTAQEDSFVYESNLGGINICVGTSEPILMQQQAEGPADSLAAEWKRVRSRPNLNNCLVVNGQHGCGEF